jgi:hypothetical protein
MADNDAIPVPRAWGFPADSTAELARRLARAGRGATLTVLPYTRGELMFLHLRVDAAEGEAQVAANEPDINDSFPCPPFTGCGGG